MALRFDAPSQPLTRQQTTPQTSSSSTQEPPIAQQLQQQQQRRRRRPPQTVGPYTVAPSNTKSRASSGGKPLVAAAAAAAATSTVTTTCIEAAGMTNAKDSSNAGGIGGSGGGGSAVPGGGGGGVKGRDRGKKGSSGGSGNGQSIARKRIRVMDKELGEFTVMLTPYDGDHNDVCEVCDRGGDLLCCDFCNLVYHLRCVTPKLTELPDEEFWICPACTAEVTNRQMAKKRRVEEWNKQHSTPHGGVGGSGKHQAQDKSPSFHGVKAENNAFRAFVLYKNQMTEIGLFPTAQAAARAHDRKALSLFGDAAKRNFPEDEHVEVEGVAADGTTVKGVVRSFHQWRAELLWGNKKRHLGFFERLEHASQAYNRAALYMNGPETTLNPSKEGYLPPPPTGASVRVPRNKLFVQQLPLPLILLSQVEGPGKSAEHVRRRQQMQGKYHTPLVGDDHQVSYLPPLPPPSRPRAGMQLQLQVGPAPAASATTAAEAKNPPTPPMAVGLSVVDVVGAVKGDLSGQPTSKLPAGLESSEMIQTTAAANEPSPTTGAGIATAPCPPPSPAATAATLALQKVGKGKGPAIARDGVARPTLCPSPSLTPPMAEGVPCGGNSSEALTIADACAAGVDDATAAATDCEDLSTGVGDTLSGASAMDVAQEGSERATIPTVDTPLVGEGTASVVTSPAVSEQVDEVPEGKTSPEDQPADAVGVESGGGTSVEFLEVEAVSALPVTPTSSPVMNGSKEKNGSATLAPASSTRSESTRCTSVSPPGKSVVVSAVTSASSTADDVVSAEIELTATKELACSQIPSPAGSMQLERKPPAEVSACASEPVQEPMAARGTRHFVDTWEGTGSTPALSPRFQRSPKAAAPSKNDVTMPDETSAALARLPASSRSSEGATSEAQEEKVVVVPTEARGSTGKLSPCEILSAKVSATSPPRGSPIVAGRKRKLPKGAPQSDGEKCGRGNKGGGSGVDEETCSSSRNNSPRSRAGKSGTGTLLPLPPPPPPRPMPELSFEDVAELVWDPRSGPKPRGLTEARGQGGTAASKAILERAMWDRDSTLLERVAPAHAEKAMQVLQIQRHDVERAAQMLTVRHGIHVVGLSSVRTTRNKVAKQQASSSDVVGPCSSLGGGSGGIGGSGGGASGGGVSRSSFEGWQNASTSTTAALPAAGPAAAGAAATASRGCKKVDAQGLTREDVQRAGDAFMRHGRDLNAVQKALGWKKSRVVEYYYCVWKYSPAYQVWKTTRHQAGVHGVGTGAGSGGARAGGSQSVSGGRLNGGGLLNATSDGMRWRGSRLRTLKTPSSSH